MSKPSIITFSGSTGTIADLNTNFERIAAKFDQDIGDSDITPSGISYAKLSLVTSIKGTDIASNAGIVNGQLAQNTILGGASGRLALSTVDLVNMVIGYGVKVTAAIVSTGAVTTYSSASETNVPGATINYTPAENGSKIFIIGQAVGLRTSGTAYLQLGINVGGTNPGEGTTQTFKPYTTWGQSTKMTASCFHTYTFGSAAAKHVQLVCNSDGSGVFTIASGEAMIMIFEFKRSA